MKLIVGLGNPGKEYASTRHNVGFMILDEYIGNEKWQEKFNAFYTTRIINGEKVLFVKPTTFMNNSGLAVGQFVKYYDISLKDILVIQDDLDELIGDYKIKVHSSSGGHNGIKSIIASLHSQDFARLKVGIKSELKNDVIDFVLGTFSKKEIDIFNNNLDTYKKIIESFVIDGIDKTMNVYNTK